MDGAALAARHGGPEAAGGPPAQYLTFMLGAEVFALPIAGIKEILQFSSVTEVPLTPSFVRGVINLRGAVVPVIDLAVRLGRATSPVGRRTCIVIVDLAHADNTVVLGFIVDQVNEVLEFEAASLRPAPSFGASVCPDFVRGIARRADRFVMILDQTRALSVDELASLARDMRER